MPVAKSTSSNGHREKNSDPVADKNPLAGLIDLLADLAIIESKSPPLSERDRGQVIDIAYSPLPNSEVEGSRPVVTPDIDNHDAKGDPCQNLKSPQPERPKQTVESASELEQLSNEELDNLLWRLSQLQDEVQRDAQADTQISNNYVPNCPIASTPYISTPPLTPYSLTQQIPAYRAADNEKNTEGAMDLLRSILVEPSLNDPLALIDQLNQRLVTVEKQVSDPSELVELEEKIVSLQSRTSNDLEAKIASLQSQTSSELTEKLTNLAQQQQHLQNIPRELTDIRQHLDGLENLIYDRQKLIALLLPLIGELLSAKVNEAREEMVRAIAPVTDSMIEAKIAASKEEMSAALAPIMVEAIAKQIESYPGVFAITIGPEIEAAIRDQVRKNSDEMVEALYPIIGKTIKEQVRQNSDEMVDALYPIIGDTISKYLAEAIKNINQRVESALSPAGIMRKIRAKTQGVSEAELILQESMPVTVKAVFLIHKASGLLIAEAQPHDDQKLESEMIAGMLTAIRSFVNDCIAQTGQISELSEIDYGGSRIILEVAGYCYLAVVVEGSPNDKFLQRMRKTLGNLIKRHSKIIEQFDGDPEKVPQGVRSLLTDLILDPKDQQSANSNTLFILLAVIFGIVLVPWGIWQYRDNLNRNLVHKVSQALEATPELSVYRLTPKINQDTLELHGRVPNQYLRNLATQVAQRAVPDLAKKHQIANQVIAVHLPPDPQLTASEVSRLTTLLNQQSGIAIRTHYEQQKDSAGKVTIEGTVKQQAEAHKVTQAFAKIPGIQSVTNTVRAAPPQITIKLFFKVAKSQPEPIDMGKLKQVKALLDRYPEYRLKIIGRSDPRGSLEENSRLALERAKAIEKLLISDKVDPKRLQTIGIPTITADLQQPLWVNRRVEFEFDAFSSGKP